jgi:ribosomal protein S18 acetylase RimI-like enzyme
MKPEVERLYPGSWDEENALKIVTDNLDKACVLDNEGKAVGCYYWWVEEPSMAVLHSIQIVVEHRNKGVGCWVMACFETQAREHGLRNAGLAVFEGNPAIRLYERIGYAVSGRDGPSALEMRKSLE